MKKYQIYINEKSYFSDEQFISGKTLKALGNISHDHIICFKVRNRLIEIEDEDTVDLGHSGAEQFVSNLKK